MREAFQWQQNTCEIIVPIDHSSCGGTQQLIYTPHPSPSSSGTTQPSSPITSVTHSTCDWLMLFSWRFATSLVSPEEKLLSLNTCHPPPTKVAGHTIDTVKFVTIYSSVLLVHGLCFPFSAWGSQVRPRRPKLFGALQGIREAVLRQDWCPVGAMSKPFPSLLHRSGSLVPAV